MECPICKNELEVKDRCLINMDNYHKACTVRTLCCGNLIRMWPIDAYGAGPYTGDATEDDWGD